MITIKVHIQETRTGQVVTYSYEVEEKYFDTQEFWWNEGNASCDCNRKLFFYRELGVEKAEEDLPCTQGYYLVNLENEAGAIFHREFE